MLKVLFARARRFTFQLFEIVLLAMILAGSAGVYQEHVVEFNCWPFESNQAGSETSLTGSTRRRYKVGGILFIQPAQLRNRSFSDRMKEGSWNKGNGWEFYAACVPTINTKAVFIS